MCVILKTAELTADVERKTRLKRYRVSKEGRVNIIYGMVSTLQNGKVGTTMPKVARAMGLVPSTYVANLLWVLYNENAVTFTVVARKCGGYVRLWRILRPGETHNAEKHEE